MLGRLEGPCSVFDNKANFWLFVVVGFWFRVRLLAGGSNGEAM